MPTRRAPRMSESTLSPTMTTSAARNFSLLWIILNCLVPLAPMVIGQDVEIAWQAHLGGFFTGLLLVPFFEPGAPKPVAPTQRL